MLVTEMDGLITGGDLPIIFWRNIVTTTTLSATSEDPNFPISNAANASLGLKWKQDFTDSPALIPTYITINIYGAGLVNYVAIAGHNLNTAGVVIALEGGESGYSPVHHDSPPIGEYITGFTPDDDSPLILFIEAVETDTLRLRIESHGMAAEIAVVYCGYATVLPEGIQADHSPLPLAKRNNVVLGNSENGSFLGRIVLGDWAESTASIANLTKAWVREELLDFLDFAAEFPFFYAWSPETYPAETAFAYLNNDPIPVFDIDGFAAVDLAMKGIIE